MRARPGIVFWPSAEGQSRTSRRRALSFLVDDGLLLICTRPDQTRRGGCGMILSGAAWPRAMSAEAAGVRSTLQHA